MANINNQHNSFNFFYDLVEEACAAIDALPAVSVSQTGVKELFKELSRQKIKPAYGSIRLDRDQEGQLFLQEFRPGKGLLKRGYFHSLNSDRPLWETLGNALIRLHRQTKIAAKSKASMQAFYILFQGNIDKKYLRVLMEQGRVSYDTRQNHLTEEPIFSAATVLAQLQPDQIIEMNLNNIEDIDHDLTEEISKSGKSVQEIACVLGQNEGHFYTAPRTNGEGFSMNDCRYKVIPVEIARAIVTVANLLIKNKRLLVLDHVTREALWEFFINRNKYYFILS